MFKWEMFWGENGKKMIILGQGEQPTVLTSTTMLLKGLMGGLNVSGSDNVIIIAPKSEFLAKI